MSARFVVKLGSTFPTEDTPGTAGAGDGFAPADSYEPIAVSVVCNGEIGEARILAALLPEDMDADVSVGDAVQITDTQSDNEDDESSDVVAFNGVVVKKHVVISGKSTTAEIVAYNMGDYLLHRIACHGQYRRSPDKESDFWTNGPQQGSPISATIDTDIIQIDSPLIFNPDGSPNMTADSFTIGGDDSGSGGSDDFSIFEVPFRNQKNKEGDDIQADYWTLTDAITYLLNIFDVSSVIDPDSYDTSTIISTLPDNPIVSNINCEGKSLAHALADLLEPHNYGYWISPGLSGSSSLHQINFFARGAGNATALRLSTRGTNAGSSTANAVNLDLTFDASPVVNCVSAYGDRLSYTTLAHSQPPSGSSPSLPTLVKAWKPSDLTFAYVKGSTTTVNPDDPIFKQRYCNRALIIPPSVTEEGGDDSLQAGDGDDSQQKAVYGVGRMWLVNLGESTEDDLEDLTQDLTVPSGTGDSSTVTGNNSIDTRRCEKPDLYTQNTAGGLLHQEDVVVEMTLDGGKNWNIIDKSQYRLLPESMGLVLIDPTLQELGLYFTTDNPDWKGGTTYWQVLSDDIKNQTNNLQIRILCAIKSDERLSVKVKNDGGAFPLAVAGVYNNQGYKRVLYNSAINDSLYYTKFPPAQLSQDDTEALTTLVNAQMKSTNRIMVSGRAEVLMADLDEYLPGMTISSIENRTFDFSSSPTIIRVIYKLSEQQTEIVLDNRRVQSVLRARPITSAQDRQQHHLGIEGVTPTTGGHQVPFLPGVEKSKDEYYENGGT